jgi:hypothetical protein
VAASSAFRAHRGSPRAAYLGEASGASERATLFDGKELLRRADRSYREGRLALGAGAGGGDESLGRLVRSRASDREIAEHIRASLREDKTFQVDQSDGIYSALKDKVGAELHFVVCGHTHLRRAFKESARRAYFNSGTWLPLLNLTHIIEHERALPAVLQALDARTDAQLKQVMFDDVPLLAFDPTVVILQAHATGAVGWLASGTDDPAADTFSALSASRVEVQL